MAKLECAMPIQEVMSNVTCTIRITGLIKWRLQLWLATRLFKLAAHILNMDIKVA